MIRTLLFALALVLTSPVLALTPNLPAGSLGPGMIVQTHVGPMDCIVYSPRPLIPPGYRKLHTRGVYAADISIATGWVYSTRVLQSSGDRFLDNAVLETLQKWRFRPRSIYKLIVPIDFIGTNAILGGQR